VLKHAAGDVLLRCLRSVGDGQSWVDREAMAVVMRALSQARSAEPSVNLSKRELEVARLVAAGLRNKEIAASLGITEGTVKMYLHTLFDKLEIGSRVELAMLVRDRGI
jgi:two-component system, NarL family, nitrate/nitrite response regulator NarL